MSSDNVITVWGASPLTQYFALMEYAERYLPMFVNRDAQAIELVRNPVDALAAREYRKHWNRQQSQFEGRTIRTPRIWTRADQREVDLVFGDAVGGHSNRRAMRLAIKVRRLERDWFREALKEAREDTAGARVVELLAASKEAIDRLCSAAHDYSERGATWPKSSHFNRTPVDEITELRTAMFDYLKPPPKAAGRSSEDAAATVKITKTLSQRRGRPSSEKQWRERFEEYVKGLECDPVKWMTMAEYAKAKKLKPSTVRQGFRKFEK